MKPIDITINVILFAAVLGCVWLVLDGLFPAAAPLLFVGVLLVAVSPFIGAAFPELDFRAH